MIPLLFIQQTGTEHLLSAGQATKIPKPLGKYSWGCVGEGNGTLLQYSCLENARDGGNPIGCSPWGHKELDTTGRLHFHCSFSCIGEGNGNPLYCSCLENPRDGGAWWAAIYGIALGRT